MKTKEETRKMYSKILPKDFDKMHLTEELQTYTNLARKVEQE